MYITKWGYATIAKARRVRALLLRACRRGATACANLEAKHGLLISGNWGVAPGVRAATEM
jgi:hypothetical protein